MLPIIGITCATKEQDTRRFYRLRDTYLKAVTIAGGAPIILPLGTDDLCVAIAPHLDGLILSGGPDIPPDVLGIAPQPGARYMTDDRWRSECLWFAASLARRIPVLGICLGMQVMNVAAGGTLINDIPTEYPTAEPHYASDDNCNHPICIQQETILANLVSGATATVRSAHHQAIDQLGEGFQSTAWTGDGLIEAIEYTEGWIVGVQWHPERALHQPDWLLTGFINACAAHLNEDE